MTLVVIMEDYELCAKLEESPKVKSIKKCVKINVLKNIIVAQNDERGVSKYRNIDTNNTIQEYFIV